MLRNAKIPLQQSKKLSFAYVPHARKNGYSNEQVFGSNGISYHFYPHHIKHGAHGGAHGNVSELL